MDGLVKEKGGQGITAEMVQRALGLRSLFLAERLLVALGGAQRRFETAEEFVTVAQRLMAAPVSQKLEFMFRFYDIDGDGAISREELDRLVHIALAENDLRLSDQEADKLVDAVMVAGDRDGDKRIGPGEFVTMMLAHPELQRRLADYGVSLLMPGKRARQQTLLPGASWSGWVRNGVVLAFWLALYAGVNTVLFMEAVLRHQAAGANLYVQIARGCGACLNFNAALIVIPMLRHTLTWVRRSAFGGVMPVDDAVAIHGLIGELVVLLGVVHAVAHFLNARIATLPAVVPWIRANQTNATGVGLLGVLVLMWIFSRRFVRRSGRFELFHITHLGYFAVVGLLFVHGPRFWMWGTLPWAWYLLERLIRTQRRRLPSRVLTARALAADVTKLEFERPRGFDYTPGDYVFLRIPAVARQEWHPFTLTSAPEDPKRLAVHIRSAGNWTSAVFDRINDRTEDGEATLLHIDGPYGSASRHIFDTPHAVAIAAGIGVTPFASILQSLLLSRGRPGTRLQKLHFIWLNREQHSFAWFSDLLGELEKRDSGGLLEFHIFMTAGRSDMAGGVLDVAQHVLRSSKQGDIVTGLRAHTALGTPDFDRLLEGFYRTPHLPRPEVFFCGPAPLGRVVAKSCQRLGLRFRRETILASYWRTIAIFRNSWGSMKWS